MSANKSSDTIHIHSAIDAVGKKYQLPKDDQSRIVMINDLGRVCSSLGAITREGEIIKRRIQGIRVLDIACGNGMDTYIMRDAPIPANMRRIMEPWLCRMLAHLGARVTGIDMKHPKYVKKEKGGKIDFLGFQDPGWKFVQRDLATQDAIDTETFPDASFDAVNCKNFIGNDIEISDDPSNILLKLHDLEAYNRIMQNIRNAAMRVLKPGGILMWNREAMKK